ncbi:hypothetical protein AHF37_03330 [Paragonimus kellicotti]|nr:hypothetical protein AHF37_03330 [Paragonimus kellicotti]
MLCPRGICAELRVLRLFPRGLLRTLNVSIRVKRLRSPFSRPVSVQHLDVQVPSKRQVLRCDLCLVSWPISKTSTGHDRMNPANRL